MSMLDITVLSGGPGLEREVSLNSGAAVGAALRRLGHRVNVSDISPANLSALNRACDIVFIALHGEFGEDGVLQAELDRRGIRYTGSGAEASRLAMDKPEAKRAFQRVAIPTPAFVAVTFDQCAAACESFALPAIVKPPASGSSVDTVIARDRAALRSAAEQVAKKYGTALIEQYITGPELTVGVLGDRVLPVCEIRTQREFYDYQAKYLDNDTQYVFDLDLPTPLLERVQMLSAQTHRALGCEVFSRVDWMVDAVTHEPYVLEVNTIPGFTGHSLLPKAAARVGIPFDELCARIVELSLQKYGS